MTEKEMKTNKKAKELVKEITQWFVENPKYWICDSWCETEGKKHQACLTGQMAIELGLYPKFVEKLANIDGNLVNEYIAEKLGVGERWVEKLTVVNDESADVNELQKNVKRYLRNKKTPYDVAFEKNEV